MQSKVLEEIYDNDNKLLYEKRSDGYVERNTYNENGKLIRQDITYPNGIREVERWND